MPLLLLVAFIVVPLVELWVIVQVGNVLGLAWTLLLLLVVSIGGAVLVKREGLAAWRRLLLALRQARMPAREVVDGALVLLGGALLLTPGFVTDAVGLLLVVPPTRRALNAVLRRRARGLFGVVTLLDVDAGTSRVRGEQPRQEPERSHVEIVKVEREPRE